MVLLGSSAGAHVEHRTPAQPVHGPLVQFEMRTPFAPVYSTDEQPLRGPAARAVMRAFPHLRLSRALSRAAAVYARILTHETHHEPPIAFLEFLVHWAGCPDPSAAATVSYTTFDGPQEAVRAVRNLVSQRDMRDITGIGIAKVPGDGRPYRWRWGVLAVDRLVQMRAFPSSGSPGASLPLQFRLQGGLTSPEVWVLLPGGRVKRLPAGRPQHSGGFAVATVPLGPTRGILRVEIVGHGPEGPEVAANFPVFVGEAAPRKWSGFAPPDEGWVRTAHQAETLMIRLVNQDRTRWGLPPLMVDPRLVRIARAHSRDMAVNGYFGHTSPRQGTLATRLQAADYPAVWCGENIAEADSIAGAEADLMRSPGHRANILAVEATHLGIGIIARPAGTGTHWLITQEFARPASALSAAGFRAAVRRVIRAKRAGMGLPAIPASDTLDRIAAEMAARVAAGALSETGVTLDVAGRLRRAGISFERLNVVTYRLPVPGALKPARCLLSPDLTGLGIGAHAIPQSPLRVVVLIVTMHTDDSGGAHG